MSAPPPVHSPVEYWIEYEFDSVVESMGLIEQEELSRFLFWSTSDIAARSSKTTISKLKLLAEIGDVLA